MVDRCARCCAPLAAAGPPQARFGGPLCALCVATAPGAVLVRAYRGVDRGPCLACFESNLPDFFAPHEHAEFVQFLDEQVHRFPYYVVEDGGTVVGCGGHFVYRNAAEDVGLIWGMVHRAHHRRGLGRALLAHRLEIAGRAARRCLLDTTPESFGFYARMGFVQTGFERDGYAPGMHKVIAECPLAPPA